jgi:methylenetetrahydrofolate dehydrogenase (NADP+) / methenyltetrahydrofolate cyclohydrolase
MRHIRALVGGMIYTMNASVSPRILSGIEARDARIPSLMSGFQKLVQMPEVAIIQVGDRPDSAVYIRAKQNLARKLGIVVRHIHIKRETVGRMESRADQKEIVEEIHRLNGDSAIKGIIVQLPLPDDIDKDEVIGAIDPCKDIDGLTKINTDLFDAGDARAVIPATARGIMDLLAYHKIDVQGKQALVIGRSALVGKPVARLLAQAGAHISVAHSKTSDLKAETIRADIIIVAVGKPKLIGADQVRQGQIIVDVGINRAEPNSVGVEALVGDVDFESVKIAIGSSGAITPVPGGVGPMTVLALFENLLDVCKRR